MDVKVKYAKITKRVVAYVVDQIVFEALHLFLFILFVLSCKLLADFFSDIFSDTNTVFISVQLRVLEMLLFIALETLMITKLGWTPGKLLCGIYIKDANTLENVALIQAVIRSALKMFLWLPSYYISIWFLVLPMSILITAVFDRHSQFLYDKIVKTVVVDYKPGKYNLDYAGMTRRAIAYAIDRFIVTGICVVFFSFVKTIFGPEESRLLTICLYFLLSIVLGIFMIRKFNGTPGQLLCCIHIRNVSTLKNITIMQATIRYILFEVFSLSVLSYIFIIGKFSDDYISEWWFPPLSNLILMIIVLIFIYAIFDRHKQFFYDKIAKTVAIDYRPPS